MNTPSRELRPVSPSTLEELDRVCAEVEARVVAACIEEDTAPELPPAPAMTSGMGFVTRMLRTSMELGAGAMLDDQIEWGKTRLPAYGLPLQVVLQNFERYAAQLRELLSPAAFAEVEPYLDSLIQQQRRAIVAATERESP